MSDSSDVKRKKLYANNAINKQKKQEPVPEGMGRCMTGFHLVPIDDMTFCPVDVLGMTYKGPKGQILRSHCKKHFPMYRARQKKYAKTEKRKEATRRFLVEYRKSDKHSTIGYVASNVEPRCSTCNYLKRQFSMEDVMDMCRSVVGCH